MGCSDPREKIENEMMKIKMSRIEIQMERYNQLEKLKGINGGEIKMPIIPDYIDQKFLNDRFVNKRNSSSSTNKSSKASKEEIRKRPGRSKSFAIKKRKNKVFNFDEEKESKRPKRRNTYKKKTYKF